MRTCDHPTILAESTTVFGPTLRDHGPDAALTQRTRVPRGIVASIGVADAGLLEWSTTDTANRRNCINEWQQLRDVVGVRTGQDRDDRIAVGVNEDVVLGTGSRTIRGVRASFLPAPTARPDDESTASYDRSIWPAARNLSSSN